MYTVDASASLLCSHIDLSAQPPVRPSSILLGSDTLAT